MQQYTSDNTFKLAKRQNNAKRAYLLVNPLQAKHIPVSPTKSLRMMRCFGEQLAEKYPCTKLVIGFAETATAIGAAAAACFSEDCIYIHTTREEVAGVKDWICFLEEHSHAMEQKLCGDHVEQWLAESPQIIFIDDELSTGKTLINIIEQLRLKFPSIKNKTIVAASVINRLTKQNTRRLLAAGIKEEYLVKLPDTDYSDAVSNFDTIPVMDAPDGNNCIYECVSTVEPLMRPHTGVLIKDYRDNCQRIAKAFVANLNNTLSENNKILVLGTEECMYPALILGEELETMTGARVRCHATTRSPIGVCSYPGYPITKGYRLHSFYAENRETYIYNTEPYDMAIVLTDTDVHIEKAFSDMSGIWKQYGCTSLLYLKGGQNV